MLEPFDYRAQTKSGFWYYTSGVPIQHITFEHPEPIETYLQRAPQLTSVAFDFSKSNYKKNKKFSHEDQLKDLFLKAKTSMTRLAVNGSNQLTKIPNSIKRLSLRSLTITNCDKLTDIASVLKDLPDLEALELGGKFFDVGATFPHLPKLRFLHLKVENISSLEGLDKCQNLEGLLISKLIVEKLPTSISNLPNLQKIDIRDLGNLKTLPRLDVSTSLESIMFLNLPKVENLEIGFAQLKSLKSINMSRVGNNLEKIDFPQSLVSCENLEGIGFANCPIHELPIELRALKKMKGLSLHGLNLETIPEIFDTMNEMKELGISSCLQLKSLPKSIGQLENLTRVLFEDLSSLEKIDFDFSKLKSLQQIFIKKHKKLNFIHPSIGQVGSLNKLVLNQLNELSELPPLGSQNENLTEIEINNLPQLETFPTSFCQLPKLERLRIRQSNNIKRMPAEIGQLKTLQHLYCISENFEYTPLEVVEIPTLDFVNLNTIRSYENKDLLNVSDVFRQMRKIEDLEVQKAVVYWVGLGYEYLPLTKALKIKTLESLSYTIKNYPLYLFSKIHRLNSNNAPVNLNELAKGTKVWLNGKMQGSKTDLKNKLKELGFDVASRYSDKVTLVVIGQKPSIPDDLFDRDISFVSQLEIENFSKIENPGLLQKADVPDDFIHNLQQLIWSADPQNEAVALELVKSNGLPESVEEDFLLLAKTCKDKNLKNRVRNFLKGKLSAEKQKALSIGTAPFHVKKLAKTLTTDSLTKMYYSQFKRTGHCKVEFLNSDEGQHSGRAEVFQAEIKNALVNPKYLKYRTALLPHEWQEVFMNPIFKGVLNRCVINLYRCHTLPKALVTEHLNTMKKLDIYVDDGFEFESLYALNKLNDLNVRVHGNVKVSQGIGGMKRLRNLLISTNGPIEYPDDLLELDKLKTLSIQASNKEKFMEKFGHFYCFSGRL